jgi:hypothetical protein
VLVRLQGLVEHAPAVDASPIPIVGVQQVAPDEYAITGAQSLGALKLPDSSVVSLGETTRVRAGEFLAGVNGPGSTITIEGGSLHFYIKHPEGAKANYTFVTPTAQVAVRGTEGMIESQGNFDSVAVVDGTEDDVVVTTKEGESYKVGPKKTLRLQRMRNGKVRPIMLEGIRSPGFRQFREIVIARARERAIERVRAMQRARQAQAQAQRRNAAPARKEQQKKEKP